MFYNTKDFGFIHVGKKIGIGFLAIVSPIQPIVKVFTIGSILSYPKVKMMQKYGFFYSIRFRNVSIKIMLHFVIV